MQWNEQQSTALKLVNKWISEYYNSRFKTKQVFYLAGYAGTGKTTLAQHFANNITGETLYAAFTGKAALVMRNNGCYEATTIHSLIYTPIVDNLGQVTFRLNDSSALNSAALLIIDECSMVDEILGKDVLSFGKPILVLGDPAQLPPVSGTGFFTEQTPDVMLTQIHRQAEGNPIIMLATMVREGQIPQLGKYGESKIVKDVSSQEILDANQILVGRNVTRTVLNKKIRQMKKFNSDLPVVHDKLICLRNNRKLGLFNGGLFEVNKLLKTKRNGFIKVSISNEEIDNLPVQVHKSFFDASVKAPDWKLLKGTEQFDFGYALTAHKSQGSQWSNVLIYNEAYCFRDEWRRWLYTAITRASEKITIVNS